MSQLSTLTVSRDPISVDDDAGDDGRSATTSGPPGSGICDPEICCDRSTGVTDRERWDNELGADGAGQRDGDFRRGSSVLRPRMCVVHRHRTGPAGDTSRPIGSRGDERGPSGQEDDDDNDADQRLLLDVMNITDREARLTALHQYFAAAATQRRGDGGTTHDRPASPRPTRYKWRPTWGFDDGKK